MTRNALNAGLATCALALGGLLAIAGGSAAYSAPAGSGIAPATKPYTGEDTVQNFGAPGVPVDFLTHTFPSGTAVNILVAGVSAQTAVVSETGELAFTVTVPESATPGSVVPVTVTAGDVVVPFSIEVTAVPAIELLPVSTPAQGGDATAMIWFGAGALALAGAAVTVGAVTRRSRAQV